MRYFVILFLQRRLPTLALLLCIIGILLLPFQAHALIPFGGRTLITKPCNTGLLALIGPPVGGEYMYTLATRTYLYGPPSVPRWVLGNAGPPGLCFLGQFYIGAGPIMMIVGSSGGI
ncbi:MAG: hypothetical protein WD509_01305 [Candidatus Paceibacterota bacterium]